MFYIGLYRKNVKKSSCLKAQGQEPEYLVFSINKCTSTMFVQVMTLVSKMVLPRGHVFYIGLYMEDKKKSSLKQQSLEP